MAKCPSTCLDICSFLHLNLTFYHTAVPTVSRQDVVAVFSDGAFYRLLISLNNLN